LTAPLAALMGVLADLCGDVPAGAQDRDAAAAYAAVGDEARAAGDTRVAAVAYRKALAADPAQADARSALDALCRDDATRAASDASGDDSARLAAAIDRYRAGDLDVAARELEPIAAGSSPSAAGAHLFLGLIALARHDGGTANRELESASHDPTFAALVAPLQRLARRDGLVAVQLVAEPELDTNPSLLPDTPPAGASTGAPRADEDLLLVGALTARPRPWLAVRNTVLWRDQRTLTDLDFIADDAQGEATIDRGRDHVSVRYDFDADLLAGDLYLLAHRAGAAYKRDLSDVAIVTSYAIRRRAYQGADEAPFTGWVHAGDAGVQSRIGDHVDVEARALATREETADPTFSAWTAGAQAIGRWRPMGRARVAASATSWYARYDGAEPEGQMRRDTHVEGALDAELDLGDFVIAIAGLSAAHNDSTVEDFRYDRVIARVGVSVLFGVP